MLDDARAEVRVTADPQAAALGVSPIEKAGVLVAMCLIAGLIIAEGWGLLFGSRRR